MQLKKKRYEKSTMKLMQLMKSVLVERGMPQVLTRRKRYSLDPEKERSNENVRILLPKKRRRQRE